VERLADMVMIGALAVLLCAGGQVSAGTTECVSVASAGHLGDNDSPYPVISGDGKYVVFRSLASNLVDDDTNEAIDVFVRDRVSGLTVRVSVNSQGEQANGYSYAAALSADGRYVAFQSYASNLVEGDHNGASDIFVHDRQSGLTSRVSVDSGGAEANGHSGGPGISADGRFVTFESAASNLVPDDTNGVADIFLHDRESGETIRVSKSSSGEQADAQSDSPCVSTDGRFVAFRSDATNLVPDDTNGCSDIFVYDRLTGQTRRVSVDSAGEQANDVSQFPAFSADGRYVSFASIADNLVAGDTNEVADVFVHDCVAGTTVRASLSTSGEQADGDCFHTSISGDGRYVAFASDAANLVEEDTNDQSDIFVRDLSAGRTTRVSVDAAGLQANGFSSGASLSANGRHVAFHSAASNLVPGDENGRLDSFVRDRGAAQDADEDGDVDLADFTSFQVCFNGPNRPHRREGCGGADFDSDGDVDLADFTSFQLCFNGPNRRPRCW